MTRAEALKLNKKYQLSDEVKEILEENGFNCQFYVAYTEFSFGKPVCYGIDINGYYEGISFTEVRNGDNIFDRYARKILYELGILERM